MKHLFTVITVLFMYGCTSYQSNPLYKQYSSMSCDEIANKHREIFYFLQNDGQKSSKKSPFTHTMKDGVDVLTGGMTWSEQETQLVNKGRLLSFIAQEKKCNYKL